MGRVAGPAAVLIAVLAGVLAGCANEPAPRAAAPTRTAVRAIQSPEGRSGSATSPRLERCRAHELRIAVTMTGSEMSQPFADVAITNTGATPCLLRGYPRLRAWGHRGWADGRAPSVRLGILVHRGVYERVDHGRHRVAIRPGHRAVFSIGTAMAFQGGRHVFTLTRMTVVLPGTNAPKVLPLSLPATRPRAARFPVGITAVTASAHPQPSSPAPARATVGRSGAHRGGAIPSAGSGGPPDGAGLQRENDP